MNQHARIDPIPFIDLEAQRRRLGRSMNDAVARVLTHCQFVMGPEVAALETELALEVRGRDLVAGLPKTVEVRSDEIREALSEPIGAIIDRVKSVLESTPPELSSDIIERGIMLTGGVALLRGLDKLLASQTGIPIHVAEDPLSCVAIGCGRALDQIDAIRDRFIESGFE